MDRTTTTQTGSADRVVQEVQTVNYWSHEHLPVQDMPTPGWATRTEIDRGPYETYTRHTYSSPTTAEVDATEDLGRLSVGAWASSSLARVDYADQPIKPPTLTRSFATVCLRRDCDPREGDPFELNVTVAQARRLRVALDDVLQRLDADDVGNLDVARDEDGRRRGARTVGLSVKE